MKRKSTTTGRNGKGLQKKVKTTVVSVATDGDDASDVIDDEVPGPAAGDDDDGSLHRTVDLLSKQVSSLQSTVGTMRSQIDFLLSVLGWTSVPSVGSGGGG